MHSKRQPPSFLYFDLGNVLLHFDRHIAFRAVAELGKITPERVEEILTGEGLQWSYEAGELNPQQFHARFVEMTGTSIDEAAFHHACCDIFWINPTLPAVVTQLELAGHRLGILSNTCQAHWEYCTKGRYAILPRSFGVFALSYEIGAIKPQPQIYERAIELAGVPAEEIFFVDDMPENVAAARAAGIDAVQYTSTPALVDALWERGLRFNH